MRSRTKDSQLLLYSYLSLEPLTTSITMFSICGGLSPAGMSFQTFMLGQRFMFGLLDVANLGFVQSVQHVWLGACL